VRRRYTSRGFYRYARDMRLKAMGADRTCSYVKRYFDKADHYETCSASAQKRARHAKRPNGRMAGRYPGG
jgi:hypothetical protein